MSIPTFIMTLGSRRLAKNENEEAIPPPVEVPGLWLVVAVLE
jgi:hypothetical protein